MSRKKVVSTQLSEEDHNQVQRLFEQYHQIAERLHGCIDQRQGEAALTDLNLLSETAQIAFLKSLSQEKTVDAADVLVGINALSQSKEVRKEARRSLIRLEASRIYPQWTPPLVYAPAVQVQIANPPRFWKGWATQTREEGEIHLLLAWEQGYDYSEARVMIFSLDFWDEGVNECLVDIGPKRRIEEQNEKMRTKLADVPKVDCSLAEGKRLVEEALSVNQWHGTQPHQTYRQHLPVINRLLMQNTADLGEDRGLTFINPELEDQEIVINFIGAWSMRDYGLAYDLLTKESSFRDDLTRDEWIERRRAWADEAHPARLELGFVHERERSQNTLWLPTSVVSSRSLFRKEIEIGWSLELTDTPLSGTLKEMPMGTSINKETGRHWFWTCYTLVREQDGWRIQRITDEGANIQGLPIPELQQRIKAYEEVIQTKAEQRETDSQGFTEELAWRLTQLLHLYDALIAHLPLDYQTNAQAYTRSLSMGNPERIMVYLERWVQRFPEQRVDILRRLGSIITALAYKYDAPEMKTRQEHLLARAEETIREAIALDTSSLSYVLLAELFISQDRNDEAESALLKAKTITPSPEEEASIESGLGTISMRRERMDEAVTHYQRVREINPDYPGIWFSLGFAHRLLGHFTDAEMHYQHAIKVAPDDIRPYSELTAIYMNQRNKQKARDIVEQGIRANPDSAHLHALFASVLFELGDQHGAQLQLDAAEAIDPTTEIVQSVRQYIQNQTSSKRR